MRTGLLCLTLALLGGLDSAHGAEIYKWKDGNDVTTFSQLPPADGVSAERLQRNGDLHLEGLAAASAPLSWRALLPPAPSAALTQRVERSDVRLAETPAEQELSERLEATPVLNLPRGAPRLPSDARWIEVGLHRQRSSGN